MTSDATPATPATPATLAPPLAVADWFALRPLAARTWLVAEPGHVNCFLIEGDERAVLVDTGLGLADIHAAARTLTDRPVLAVNSHGHDDHRGGNWLFDDIAAHPAAAPAVTSAVAPQRLAAYLGVAREQYAAYRRRRADDERFFHQFTAETTPRPVPPAADAWTVPAGPTPAPLTDGQRLDLGGRELTVLHTPGHSPDSLCLFDERAGLLFAGDTLITGDFWVHQPDAAIEIFAATLRTLHQRLAGSIREIFPAHTLRYRVGPDFLRRAADAFDQVVAGRAPGRPGTDLLRRPALRHDFADFSILRPLPAGVTPTDPAPAPNTDRVPAGIGVSSVWRERGEPLVGPVADGALTGLRVAVKDLFAVGGYRVGAGNPTWLARAPVEPRDADAVAMLRAAGASIVGIAQTDELAFGLSGVNVHYGTPPNPAAPDRVTGGSSSGPAAAVAAGQADIGLGTDTAGSVRVPASVCGLYGLRPTPGLVPTGGLLGLAPSFDTVGWLAADADVLRGVGEVLLPSGPPPEGEPTKPTKLLVVDSAGLVTVAARLADVLGADLVVGPVREDDDVDGLLEAFRVVQAAQAWRLRGGWIRAHPGALGETVAARFRVGATIDADVEQAAAGRIAEGRARLLDRLGLTTWVVRPAAGGPGHPRDAGRDDTEAWRRATLRATVVASAYGLPSCVVPTAPSGRESGGPDRAAPVGAAIVGPPGADRLLLDAAVAFGRPGAT